MATSGTIGTTTIKTARLIEKAVSRCGVAPQTITPEIIDDAKEDLYMLLMGISTRGLNLWCVDTQYLGVQDAKATYTLPTGTLDILNMMYCTPTILSGSTASMTATTYQETFTEDQTVIRFGVKFVTLPNSFNFQTSPDGVAWTTVETFTGTPSANAVNWYNVDPTVTASYFRLSSSDTFSVSLLYLVNEVREITMSPLNRDDYSGLPNKQTQSSFSSSYYFEKLVDPQITLWPVPDSQENHLRFYRYRAIQDVGTLTEEIEVPKRWLDGIGWQLAMRLAFILPGVDPARRAEIKQMAAGLTFEVEMGETDNAPTYFAPNISCYTR